MQPKTLFAFFVGLFLVTLAVPNIAQSQQFNDGTNNAFLCDDAAENAARETGVPLQILQAVARTESGVTVDGRFVPWPWTLNFGGRGLRFSSSAEAYRTFQEKVESGLLNIDVGCFQVNYRWHAQGFRSNRQMLDPNENARYAAAFLKGLFEEFGNWVSAVGAYHSRNKEFSESYLARYRPILEQVTGSSTKQNGYSRSVLQQNEFPLLRGNSDSGARGSLFPKSTGAGKSLFNRTNSRG